MSTKSILENATLHYTAMFIGLLFFVFGDMVTTYMATYMPLIGENNPIVKNILYTHGFLAVLLFKTSSVIFILIFDYILFINLDGFKDGTKSGNILYFLAAIMPVSMMLVVGVFATMNNLYMYHHASTVTGADPFNIYSILEILFVFV